MRCPFGRLRRRQVHPFLLERLRVVKHAGHRIVSLASDVQAASAGCVPATRRSAALPHLRSHRSGPLMAYLALLVAYSAAQIALGLWIGRRVQTAGDFFVAGRRLGPGLIFSTMLAANIGAGSTVGATGLGYRDGLAAVWWVGSAAVGSLVLALWIGPRDSPRRRRARPPHGRRLPGVPIRRGRSHGDRRRCSGSGRSSSSRGS